MKVCSHLLQNLEYKDWVVTSAAYAGLHITDTAIYCTQKDLNKHGQSHDKRTKILKGYNYLRQIWKHYRLLMSASVVARYMQAERTPADKQIDFDKYMPESKLKELLKEQLGGLIKATKTFIGDSNYKTLESSLQTHLGQFLGFSPVSEESSV